MSDAAPSPMLPEFIASTPEIGAYLDSAGGEVAFFKAVMRARPVGVHRYFHALSIRQRIKSESNIAIPIEDIWAKLSSCYDVWKLEEREGVDWPTEDDDPDAVPPQPKDYPKPDDNLPVHKHFKAEFVLPEDDFYALMVARAPAGPESPLASPSAFSVAETATSDKGRTGRGRGRGRGRGTGRGRGRGRGGGAKGGRPRASNAKKDDATNEDEESSELTEAEDASEEESAQGSVRPSGTPMNEDGESEQDDDEEEEDDDEEDAPRGRGTRGKKRGAPRGRGGVTKRRKSTVK